ncbi:MAG: hypothetical protein HY791_27075 [Deltaproteobacteria bacterium]|nr:hypothetical protein [Deltaproteobacteria bacterium]
MGKKSREKRARREAQEAPKNGDDRQEGAGAGDLRLIDILAEDFIKGVPEAETTLTMMGRDASYTVTRIGEEKRHAGLVELGKKLVALKPQVATNLYELRRASIAEHLAVSNAPTATDTTVELAWHSVALFDPAVLAADLVKGGRVRNDPKRIAAGDLAWFSLAPDERASIRFTTADGVTDEPGLKLKLRVSSGLVFVGPPEASDGPRLGEVRLDPFRTKLDEYLDKGRLVRVKAGDYLLVARRTEPGQIGVRLLPWVEGVATTSPEALVLP